jgi:hypothetical protein
VAEAAQKAKRPLLGVGGWGVCVVKSVEPRKPCGVLVEKKGGSSGSSMGERGKKVSERDVNDEGAGVGGGMGGGDRRHLLSAMRGFTAAAAAAAGSTNKQTPDNALKNVFLFQPKKNSFKTPDTPRMFLPGFVVVAQHHWLDGQRVRKGTSSFELQQGVVSASGAFWKHNLSVFVFVVVNAVCVCGGRGGLCLCSCLPSKSTPGPPRPPRQTPRPPQTDHRGKHSRQNTHSTQKKRRKKKTASQV